MLIKNAPDVYEKLRHLGGMATDDVLSPAERSDGAARPSNGWERVGPRGGVTPHAGVYRAAMPNGKRVSLLRVMFTDHCVMDCYYCPNSHWVPRRRYGFKVDELARLFADMHDRGMVDGLFLSSGIFKDPDATQERLADVVEAVRRRGFRGYVHLKVMPGVRDDALIERSQRLGARLSINMEAPSADRLSRLSAMKDFDDGILAPMTRIAGLTRERYGGAVGQVTQLVVGAADESDWDIYSRVRSLYGDLGVKRVYYSAFRPVRHTPLEERPATPPVREHRLYQLDWLSRVYGYEEEELRPAFDDAGFLELRADPKLMIAVGGAAADRFPVDVNAAAERDLLRVPGVGPLAAQRIVAQRRRRSITMRQELQAMGVVLKRALPFLRFPGHKPAPAKQSELPLFRERLAASPAPQRAAALHPAPERLAASPAPQRAAALHAAHASSGCASCPLTPTSCGMAA